MTRTRLLAAAGLSLSLFLGACGDRPTPAASDGGSAPSAAGAAAADAPATGTVIEVKMVTDGAGNYFEPADITAKPGDVIRFVLVSGVHNVSFPAADNPGASGLPGASPFLQLPGQTHDVEVNLPSGEYAFQCDPHAALGMVGTLTVE